MDALAIQGSGQLGALAGISLAEVVLVGAIIVFGIVLLVMRMRRSTDRNRRKASATGYFDRDVARYGSGGHGTVMPGEASLHNGPAAGRSGSGVPMAPSFAAPKAAGRGRPGDNGPTPPSPVRPAAGSPTRVPYSIPPPVAQEGPTDHSAPDHAGDSHVPGPPSMAEPPVSDLLDGHAVPPVPGLRPKAAPPPNLPAMPPPPRPVAVPPTGPQEGSAR